MRTTNQTPAPLSSPATPPQITFPLPPSELQQNVKATSSHPPSSSGQQITPSMPTTPTASDKEQWTLPFALAPIPPTPNLTPHTHTSLTTTPRNTFCSTVRATPRLDKHTFAASCHFMPSSAQKQTQPGSAPLPQPQTAHSSICSITRPPGQILHEFLFN
jgi:hypothetical protein